MPINIWCRYLHIQQLHHPCEVVGRFGNRQRHKEGRRIILMTGKVTSKIYTQLCFSLPLETVLAKSAFIYLKTLYKLGA
ncbi:MAG: hypothetical protein ACJAVV_000225 [Alphaproteobacteria bacterium]|jgi:hypothetical protein